MVRKRNKKEERKEERKKGRKGEREKGRKGEREKGRKKIPNTYHCTILIEYRTDNIVYLMNCFDDEFYEHARVYMCTYIYRDRDICFYDRTNSTMMTRGRNSNIYLIGYPDI